MRAITKNHTRSLGDDVGHGCFGNYDVIPVSWPGLADCEDPAICVSGQDLGVDAAPVVLRQRGPGLILDWVYRPREVMGEN